jgi:predicted transcriptional regulator
MVPGRVVKRKVVKLSRDDSTLAGLGVLAGSRRRGRCHALTFHCYNVLLKTPAETPAGLTGPPAAIGAIGAPR